jgi:cobaltochelatase CobT
MELGDDLSDAPDQDAQEEESQDGEAEAADQGEGEGEEQSPQSATLDDSEKSHRESETAESTMSETEEDDSAEPSDEELETGEGDRPARPDIKDTGKPEPAYKVYTTAHDEIVSAEELCDAEELTRLRAYLDQQLAHLSNVVGRLANRLQRRLLAQQNRTWTFDLEEGILDVARLTRVIIDPTAPLSFKQE